jgi:hypothetical protein
MPKRRIYQRDNRGRFATTGRKPRNKQVTLYHRTSANAANSIVAQQKMTPDLLGFAHFTNRKSGANSGFGKAGVTVTIPSRQAKAYANNGIRFDRPTGEKIYMVKVKHLAGKKIRRYLNA